MGLLSSAQRAAIADRPLYRQRWQLGVPDGPGGDLTWTVIHDDLFGDKRVVRNGSRETSAYNQSLVSPGKMPTGLYRFEVANGDGLFYTTTDGNYWYESAADYQANPQECYVKHQVYVKVASTDTPETDWSLLDMVEYTGRVIEIEQNDGDRTMTITSIAAAVMFLQGAWSEADGHAIDTGLSVKGHGALT